MKLKQLCVAVASATAALAAGNAAALTLDNFDGSTINVFTGGATAQDGMIRNYMRYVCQGGVDEYRFNASQTITGNVYTVSTVLQSGYFCQLSNNSSIVTDGSLQGQKVYLRKSSGDSGEGVVAAGGTLTINFLANPVVSGTTVSNYACTSALSGQTTASGSLGSIQQWSCTSAGLVGSNTLGTSAPAGFADVEFGLLNSVLTPASVRIPAATLTAMAPTSKSVAAQIFGIAVSKNFRDALQTVQGKTSGDDSDAQMPSLPSPVITAVFTGNITNWNKLTNGANTPIADTLPVLQQPLDRVVHLVRRPDSSGTQMTMRVQFLNNICTPTIAFQTPSVTACTETFDIGDDVAAVNQQQGTGGLLGCLGQQSDAGQWGIGFASTGNRPGSNSEVSTNWRWIKVDGVSPTLENAVRGKYSLVMEAVLAYRGSALTAPLPKAVIDQIATRLGDPTVLAAVNSGAATQNYASPVWYAGALALGKSAFTPLYPINLANVNTKPVMVASRSLATAASCQPLILNNRNIPVDQQ